MGNLDAPSGLPWSDVSVAPLHPSLLRGILNLQALQALLVFAHSPCMTAFTSNLGALPWLPR